MLTRRYSKNFSVSNWAQWYLAYGLDLLVHTCIYTVHVQLSHYRLKLNNVQDLPLFDQTQQWHFGSSYLKQIHIGAGESSRSRHKDEHQLCNTCFQFSTGMNSNCQRPTALSVQGNLTCTFLWKGNIYKLWEQACCYNHAATMLQI